MAKKRKKKKRDHSVLAAVLALLLMGTALYRETAAPPAELGDLPPYDGAPYVTLGDGVPDFGEAEMVTAAFESYSQLDALGRCGAAYANVCRELMPTEERGAIGMVKPSGWHTVKYDCVDGKYLYNRCHLIGYQLTGENAEERNLITGTRYLNIQGMLPFEDLVADYVRSTGNHVLYRVTPIFEGTDLLARGVRMEGWSVEDSGAGVCFDVYCYNVQPGVVIDYADGSSWEETAGETADTGKAETPWGPYLRQGAALAREWLESLKKAMEDWKSSMAFSFAAGERKIFPCFHCHITTKRAEFQVLSFRTAGCKKHGEEATRMDLFLMQTAAGDLSLCENAMARCGLVLTAEERQQLWADRLRVLRDTGRLELGEPLLPRLALAFCDSPWAEPETWAETLADLQELFYHAKGRTGLPDEELLSVLRQLFDGPAHGSVERVEALLEEGGE